MNSFIFSMCEKIFICLCLLKGIFAGYRILGLQFFSFWYFIFFPVLYSYYSFKYFFCPSPHPHFLLSFRYSDYLYIRPLDIVTQLTDALNSFFGPFFPLPVSFGLGLLLFATLFFRNVASAVNPIQCRLHLRHCSCHHQKYSLFFSF